MSHRVTVVALATCVASAAFAQNTVEVEPNESRATATQATVPMEPGHTLTGTTTGSSTVAGAASLDTWKVKVAPAAAGVYRYRLVLTTSGTAGHTVSIRGFTVATLPQAPWLPAEAVAAPTATDAAVQTSSTATVPARYVQWFGFGASEEFYVRVTGGTGTTVPYVMTLEREPVTVSDAGTYAPGEVTIRTFGQGHTTDTDMWVLDSTFAAIRGYGNDDEAIATVSGIDGALGNTLQSALRRSYEPGTYYLAVGTFNLATDQGSPSDDDFRTGAIIDAARMVVCSSTTTNLNMTFEISDAATTLQVPNTKVNAFDVNFFRFVVGGGSSCLGDLNNNGTIDGIDLTDLLAQWGGGGSADFDNNGFVEGADLTVILAGWGPCP